MSCLWVLYLRILLEILWDPSFDLEISYLFSLSEGFCVGLQFTSPHRIGNSEWLQLRFRRMGIFTWDLEPFGSHRVFHLGSSHGPQHSYERPCSTSMVPRPGPKPVLYRVGQAKTYEMAALSVLQSRQYNPLVYTTIIWATCRPPAIHRVWAMGVQEPKS
jgi:hypothetical protein